MTDSLTLSACCPPDHREVVPAIRCAGRWLSEIAPGTAMAETVASFIRRRFRQAYGADPVLRIPALLALTTGQGSLLAAVGVRNAGQENLFLEDYLAASAVICLPPCRSGWTALAMTGWCAPAPIICATASIDWGSPRKCWPRRTRPDFPMAAPGGGGTTTIIRW